MSGSKNERGFEELADGALDAMAGARRARSGPEEKEFKG